MQVVVVSLQLNQAFGCGYRIHRHRAISFQQHNDSRMLIVPVVTVSTHDSGLLKTVDAAFGVLTDVAHCLDHSAALVTQVAAGLQRSTGS